MGLSPAPQFPERAPVVYESKMGPNVAGNRGPLRFEEGVATDTDVPNDFMRGMMEGTNPAPGSMDHVDPNTQYKHANETMAERAHVGSAAWVESPTFLGDFASGAGEGNQIQYVATDRGPGMQRHSSPALVTD